MTDITPPINENDNSNRSSSRKCNPLGALCCCGFQDNTKAKSYGLLGTGRGAVVMSNIFMSTSLIYLSHEAANCVTPEETLMEQCQTKVYGFLPSSLIPNIAVITGVAAALFMPFIGAVVDYTPYRRATGIASALLIGLIQAAQIYTVSETWFPMAMLQAIAGFVYQVQVLASYAYLPDIASDVKQDVMTNFVSKFVMLQYFSQSSFLLIVVVISIILRMNSVVTAQVSQGINCFWILITWGIGWYIMPSASQRRTVPEGSHVLIVGFTQTFHTMKLVGTKFKKGMLWFFLAVIFAEAGANAFTVVSVTFMSEVLKMDGTEVAIIFIVTLVASLPGAVLAEFVTKKTDPNKSWQLCLVVFAIVTVAGGLLLTDESQKNLIYLFGVLWGVILGWFYPTENLFFSMVLPKGAETELAGFYIYCTQILVWAPPLIFTAINESGAHMKWGLMSLIIFFGIALVFLRMVSPWDEVVKEAETPIPNFGIDGNIELEEGVNDARETKEDEFHVSSS